ncbi:hypothetical protein GCM10025734_23020 [Kitasatospora paranensis]|uniref:hypothetical protein n=1 Tax=Kitasatospora paranensis TaxID=258053 RepID=UPI0031EF57C3
MTSSAPGPVPPAAGEFAPAPAADDSLAADLRRTAAEFGLALPAPEEKGSAASSSATPTAVG